MALGTIATIATIAAAAASLSEIGYQAAQGSPKVPNAASSSREVAQAQAAALPEQRALAAAEQQGGQADYTIGKHKEVQQFVKVPDENVPVNPRTGRKPQNAFKLVPYVASEWQSGGKYSGLGNPKIVRKSIKVPAGTAHADFTGYGTADINSELARKYADIETQLGKKYGTQFAEEARREAELADPQGTAARKAEYDLIQQGIDNPLPINPLSPALESQVTDQLKAGSGLDAMSKDLLDQAVARSNADREGGATSSQVEQSLSTGAEGAARRQAGIDKAQGFLSSGSTPEDIEYRREQQNLSNLGAFVGGQSPVSQFQNLSGQSQGAAPFYPGQQLPSQPAGAGAAGGPYSVAAYQAQARNAASQANPWMAGLSGLLTSVGTLGKT